MKLTTSNEHGEKGGWLTPRQVADRLGVTPRAVRAWAKDGRIPSFQLPNGRFRFAFEDVEGILTPHASKDVRANLTETTEVPGQETLSW